MKAHFFPRAERPCAPAGFTVSKKDKLPEGDFEITEYVWGETELWFVDVDEFTEDERQTAYEAFALYLAGSNVGRNTRPVNSSGNIRGFDNDGLGSDE